MKPPRVLIIAEQANPEWVSVPLVGYSLAAALARRVDAHVVTHVRNRAAFERAGWSPEAYTAIDSDAVAAPLYRLGSLLRGGKGKGWTTVTAFHALSYYYFQRLFWRRFRGPLKAGAFDLVHRITPLSPTTPSLLAGWCKRIGVPFVLGPLNGGVPWPRAFDDRRRAEREWLSYIRGAYRLMPGYGGARRHSAAILVGSGDTLEQMPAYCRDRCLYMPENAIDPSRFSVRRTRRATRPLKVVFLGRLVPYKGADMLIDAAAELVRAGQVRLEIIGEGPQREALTEQVRQRGCEAGVVFAGLVPHEQVQHRLVEHDVMALPSIREFGGGVVVEAMAVGVAPLVVDYGGPAELVTEMTGFKVPMKARSELVGSLRRALEAMVADPSSVDAKGHAAYHRAHRWFTWDAKASEVVRVYDWVLGRTRSKPHYPIPLPDEGDAAERGGGA